ncbi:MAG: hypothetical protein QOD84_37, partial [Acidobacteriaceae bacterium]
MKRTAQLLAVLAAGLALFSATGCNKL